jgi:hypothetical protein
MGKHALSYYAANRKRILARQKQYYVLNRERILAAGRAYHKTRGAALRAARRADPEVRKRIQERQKMYSERYREYHRRYTRAYYAANRERILASQKQTRQTKRESVRQNQYAATHHNKTARDAHTHHQLYDLSKFETWLQGGDL